MAFTPLLLIFYTERSFLASRRMGLSALPGYRCFVPVWVYSGPFPQDIRPVRAKKVSLMMKKATQRIRYVRTRDGVQLAWAEAGAGPLLIKAANWLTHLEYEWESPVWRHWIRFLAEHFRFVRYDERGCGMTDRTVGDVTFEQWVQDLEAVVDAAGLQEPFTLLGISQGASVCVAYAARHPERVAGLLLYGAYARGWGRRGDESGAREYEAIVELVRRG